MKIQLMDPHNYFLKFWAAEDMKFQNVIQKFLFQAQIIVKLIRMTFNIVNASKNMLTSQWFPAKSFDLGQGTTHKFTSYTQ